jgi:hypothetical protein
VPTSKLINRDPVTTASGSDTASQTGYLLFLKAIRNLPSH